jgi:hypothetical protein
MRQNDHDAPGSPSEMIGRAHYCMRTRYSPFRICRILKAPRVDLTFSRAVIPRMPGGFSYYHRSVSPGAMRYSGLINLIELMYLGPFRDGD